MNTKFSSQQGSALIIAVVAVVVIVGGGAAAYFMTDGFGTNKSDSTANIEKAIENNKPTQSSTQEKQPPSNMPDDLPLYQPAIILSSSNKDNEGFLLGLNTKDPEDQVIAWYMQQLADKGWQPQASPALKNMLKISKGNLSGSITIIESKTTDTGTTISYLIDGQS